MAKPKIVILDAYVANPGDTIWDPISDLGELTLYDRTSGDEVVTRAKDAEVVIVNKTRLTQEHLDQLPRLRLICLLATGMDNVAADYAKAKGIEVKNAKGYGSSAVAQQVFALILELTNHVALHNESVQKLEWTNNPDWSHWKEGITELNGKTLGIYGLGAIGATVARIGEAFGMDIAVTSNHAKQENYPDWKLLGLNELFEISDMISLHAPLTNENKEIINEELLLKMKPTALLINTGRGGLVNEQDLRKVLLQKKISGAALDVLSKEPPGNDHPLLGIDNCLITPHHAWAAKESRVRLIQIVADNIKEFYNKP